MVNNWYKLCLAGLVYSFLAGVSGCGQLFVRIAIGDRNFLWTCQAELLILFPLVYFAS